MYLSIKTHIFRIRYLIALLLLLLFWIGGGSEARAEEAKLPSNVARDSGNVYWVKSNVRFYAASGDEGDNYVSRYVSTYASDSDWRKTPECSYYDKHDEYKHLGYAYFLPEFYSALGPDCGGWGIPESVPIKTSGGIISSTRSGNKWVITSNLRTYNPADSVKNDAYGSDYCTDDEQTLIFLYDNETIYGQAVGSTCLRRCVSSSNPLTLYIGINKSPTSHLLSGPIGGKSAWWNTSTNEVTTEEPYHYWRDNDWVRGAQDAKTKFAMFRQHNEDTNTWTYTMFNVPDTVTSIVNVSWATRRHIFKAANGRRDLVEVTQMQEIGTKTGNTNYPQVYSGFTVKYDYNGGSGSPSSVENTTKVTLPSASRTGYDFDGWYDGNSRVGGSGGSYNVTQNVTLKAHWTPHTYTVTYHGNGGTGSPDGQKDSLTYDSSGSLRGNTLQRTYTITYQTNLGDTYSKNVTGVQNDQQDTVAYTQKGWSKTAGDPNNPDNVVIQYDFNQSKPNLTATNNANVDLYAVWRTQSKTLPTPVRHGYTFTGWYDNAGNKIGDGGASYIPRQNITLYAHWSPITYHAYYNLYGGSYGGSAEGKAFTVENAFKLDAPTLNGYTFLGWIGGTDPQDNGAWGMENPKTSTTAAKSVTVPAGTYGDVFFRAIFEKNHSVDEDGNNTDDVYVAHSKPQETKY